MASELGDGEALGYNGGERRCGRCGRRRRSGKVKLRARTGAGGCWRDNAALRRVVAGAVRATVMRGHRDLRVARGSYQCRPLKISIQSVQLSKAEPNDEF